MSLRVSSRNGERGRCNKRKLGDPEVSDNSLNPGVLRDKRKVESFE